MSSIPKGRTVVYVKTPTYEKLDKKRVKYDIVFKSWVIVSNNICTSIIQYH